ncbi:MAG: hypothetical protein C4583_00680 [Anaerolineaceae bacterium]|nr:MAG: hypothetical protein C4583_00680 [Anaerolineaceae bacterium]
MDFVIFDLFLKFKNRWQFKATFVKGLGLGGASGVLSGLFGIGGPPISIYLINSTEDIYEYLATIQLTYAVGTVIGMVMHASAGSYTPTVLGAVIVSLVPVLIGCLVGI